MNATILIRERTRTAEPLAVPPAGAVQSLRDAEHALESFRSRAAAESAKLEAARLAGLELQEEYLAMRDRRSALQNYLDVATSELATASGRKAEIESYCIGHLGTMLHDHIAEWLERKFLVDLLPPRIEQWRREIEVVDSQIHAFAAKHGITEAS